MLAAFAWQPDVVLPSSIAKELLSVQQAGYKFTDRTSEAVAMETKTMCTNWESGRTEHFAACYCALDVSVRVCLGGGGRGGGGARLHAAESESRNEGGQIQQLQAGEGVHDRGRRRQGGQPYQRGSAGRPVRLHQLVWYGPAPLRPPMSCPTRDAHTLTLAKEHEL